MIIRTIIIINIIIIMIIIIMMIIIKNASDQNLTMDLLTMTTYRESCVPIKFDITISTLKVRLLGYS